MKKKIRRAKRQVKLVKDLVSNKGWGYQYIHAFSPDLISQARKLQAEVFLAIKYIKPEDVDEHGYITERLDPYHAHSEYFLALGSGKPIATIRLIKPEVNKGLLSFQLFRHTSHDPSTYDLRDTHLDHVVEVSGFCRRKEVSTLVSVDLLATIWTYCRVNNISLWIFTLDKNLFEVYSRRYKNVIRQVAEPEHLSGSYKAQVVPCSLNADTMIVDFCGGLKNTPKHKASKLILKRFITHIDKNILQEDEINALKRVNISI